MKTSLRVARKMSISSDVEVVEAKKERETGVIGLGTNLNYIPMYTVSTPVSARCSPYQKGTSIAHVLYQIETLKFLRRHRTRLIQTIDGSILE